MPFTPGTVAEYDMLVQVTEQSINDQLKMLYWTETSTAAGVPTLPDLPVDGENIVPTQKKYLIDHDLIIKDVEDDEEMDGSGIYAHIACPTISFPDRQTARLNFRFGKINADATVDCPTELDPNTKTTEADSRLVTQKIVKNKIADVYVNLNGFSMSFEANLDRKDFTNVADGTRSLNTLKVVHYSSRFLANASTTTCRYHQESQL
jgi:hypothetical protein